MDGGRESRSRDAKKNVHPPRFAFHGGTMDAESRLVSQVETDQQHFGQTRICKSLVLFTLVHLFCPLSFFREEKIFLSLDINHNIYVDLFYVGVGNRHRSFQNITFIN